MLPLASWLLLLVSVAFDVLLCRCLPGDNWLLLLLPWVCFLHNFMLFVLAREAHVYSVVVLIFMQKGISRIMQRLVAPPPPPSPPHSNLHSAFTLDDEVASRASFSRGGRRWRLKSKHFSIHMWWDGHTIYVTLPGWRAVVAP